MRKATVGAALVLAVTLVGAGVGKASDLKVVVFDVEPVELPQSPEFKSKLADADQLLQKLFKDAGFVVVDRAPQEQKIAASSPLSQCNGCDQDIAKALGADLEVSTALQRASAATFTLSGSVKDTKSDRVLRQGVVDIRGTDPNVWAHGVKFLVKERLLQPPLPSTGADLAAVVAADAAKNGDGTSAAH